MEQLRIGQCDFVLSGPNCLAFSGMRNCLWFCVLVLMIVLMATCRPLGSVYTAFITVDVKLVLRSTAQRDTPCTLARSSWQRTWVAACVVRCRQFPFEQVARSWQGRQCPRHCRDQAENNWDNFNKIYTIRQHEQFHHTYLYHELLQSFKICFYNLII